MYVPHEIQFDQPIVPQSAPDQSANYIGKCACALASMFVFAAAVAVLVLYCPWSSCPCVTVTQGDYIRSTVQRIDHGYVVRYQYYLPAYNTNNCYRTDNSLTYETYNAAEQNADRSDYVKFTSFYYDTRELKCYDMAEDSLIAYMVLFIIVAIISGSACMISLCIVLSICLECK